MGKVYVESISIIKDETGDQSNGDSFRDLMTNNVEIFLLYLPPTLQIGEELNDNTMMTEPTNGGACFISMHSIEKVFSVSDSTRDMN
jgi:hypothetical protein